MTNDELIKHVFDNLRNVFLSVSLVTVGGAVIRYHKQLDLEPWLAFLILMAFVILSGFLLVWNAAHGISKILHGKHIVFVIPIFLLYMGMAVVALHAAPLLSLKVNPDAVAPTNIGSK